MDEAFRQRWMDDELRRGLEKYHKRFRRGETLTPEEFEAYVGLIGRAAKAVV
jgi:uncharacterized coiled-coil DUF342 family protein